MIPAIHQRHGEPFFRKPLGTGQTGKTTS
jgi:hypothetical protein